VGLNRILIWSSLGMNEPPEKPKWGKDKTFLFVATMIFLMIVLPLL